MKIFNSDGSEAEMCGNGLRCFGHYLAHSNRGDRWKIETLSGILDLWTEEEVTHYRQQTDPSPGSLTLEIEGANLSLLSCCTGVPHAVLFVPDLTAVDILRLGNKIRHHPRFAPDGVNVNFVELLAPDKIAVRTYERGVEGETEACGTGACAAALAMNAQHPIQIHFRSGDSLWVSVENENTFHQWGPAHQLFKGEILLT